VCAGGLKGAGDAKRQIALLHNNKFKSLRLQSFKASSLLLLHANTLDDTQKIKRTSDPSSTF